VSEEHGMDAAEELAFYMALVQLEMLRDQRRRRDEESMLDTHSTAELEALPMFLRPQAE